jgi:hypothetical protein
MMMLATVVSFVVHGKSDLRSLNNTKRSLGEANFGILLLDLIFSAGMNLSNLPLLPPPFFFLHLHRDTHIPRKYSNKTLYWWVKNQKIYYNRLMEGQDNAFITPEKIDLLVSSQTLRIFR